MSRAGRFKSDVKSSPYATASSATWVDAGTGVSVVLLKIGIVCSAGGHLTEVEQLLPALDGNDIFFVTYSGTRGQQLTFRKYLFEDTGRRPLLLLIFAWRFFRILRDERPDVLISTGAEIAVPFFYMARLLRIRTVFIESWCRTKTASVTARLVYPVADEFLVQWPDLLERFGEKAKYKGSVA